SAPATTDGAPTSAPDPQRWLVSRRLGSAPVLSGDGPSSRNRYQPAEAIIAALSVHMARLGRKACRPSSVHAVRNCSRNSELAATPPPIANARAPVSAAARRALATSTSTTAAWKLAATSGVDTSGLARTWLTTAVFRPLKEKSRPSSIIERGNRTA